MCSERFEPKILWKLQKLENVENWIRSKIALIVNKVKGNFKRSNDLFNDKLSIYRQMFLKFWYLEV